MVSAPRAHYGSGDAVLLTLTVQFGLTRADTCPDLSGCGTNYIRAKGGHVPQLGSCTFVRSIYYNQHTRIFGILSAEHLATPRSVRFRPIISGTCYTPQRILFPPLHLIRDVGVSIRTVSVWAGLFSPLKIGPVIGRNRGGLASQTNKEGKQIEEFTCLGNDRSQAIRRICMLRQ